MVSPGAAPSRGRALPVDELVLSPRCKERFLLPGMAPSLYAHEVLQGGLSDLYSPYHIIRRPCPYHILLFTLQGAASVDFEGQMHTLLPGTACLLTAGSGHTFEPQKHWVLMWFHLAASAQWDWLGRGSMRVIPAVRNADLLRRLMEEYFDRAALNLPLVNSVLDAAAALIVSLVQQELKLAHDPVDSGQRARFDAIWQEVASHPEKPWSIDALCRQAHCSRSWLQRMCVGFYGMSPGAKLVDLRMNSARGYLMNSRMKLDEVALRVGYSTSFAFSRAFKGHEGVSPSDFRAQMNQGGTAAGRSVVEPD